MQHAGFLSTLSLRRATPRYRKRALAQSFLSTLSLRRATFDEIQAGNIVIISIHALLAESDAVHIGPNVGRYDFYPRSPCGERPGPNERSFVLCPFLSTLSLRRATLRCWAPPTPGPFLSTLSLRRATRGPRRSVYCPVNFYPRSPCGERRYVRRMARQAMYISIHALLAESDKIMVPVLQTPRDFYPRSPCGERPCTSICRVRLTLFLSTLSLRRATVWPHQRYFPVDISIHALLAESDAFRSPRIALMVDFYPRSPCGERLPAIGRPLTIAIFLSTLSLRRATYDTSSLMQCQAKFLSTLSLRRATSLSHRENPLSRDFYPRSPCGERRSFISRLHSF